MRRFALALALLVLPGRLCRPAQAGDVHVPASGAIGLGYVSVYYGLVDPATGQWHIGASDDLFGGTSTRSWMGFVDTGASTCILGVTTQQAYEDWDGTGIPLQPYPDVKFVDEGFGGVTEFAVTDPVRLMIADFKTADMGDPENPWLYTAYGVVGGPQPPSIHMAAAREMIGGGLVDVDLIGMSILEGRVLQVDPHYLQFMRLFIVMAGSLTRPVPAEGDPRVIYVPVTMQGFFEEPQPVEVGRHPMLPMHVRYSPGGPVATRTAIFDSGSPVHFVSESFAVEAGIDVNSTPDVTVPVSGIGPGQSERPGWYVDGLALDLGRGREGQVVFSNTAVFTIPDELMPGDLQAILGTNIFAPSLTFTDTPVVEWFVDTRDDGDACLIIVLPDPATAPGDANLDGVVNVLDLGALANHYKTAGPHHWTDGDFNEDGDVNILDLGLLSNHYRWGQAGGAGGSAWPGEATQAVPEPGAVLLLAAGAAGGVCCRRRTRA